MLLRIWPKLRNAFALGLALAAAALSFSLIAQALAGKAATISWQFPLGFNFVLVADSLAVFMACVSSLITAVIVLYSFGYIRCYQNQNEYYAMVALFFTAMLGLIFSGNLILLYVFWEITAITSWRLIGFFREKNYVLKADKAFLVTAFGALLMLLGFVMIYQQFGSFDLSVIRSAAKIKPVSNIAMLLILCGIFSKSATLPFHTWLPDAGVAPSPVTALLHAAILVKIGVYCFARLFLATFPLGQSLSALVPLLAGASALVSAGAALRETDLKRIIAYSTVSQIGFIFFAFSIGNEIAITAALLYILTHGLAKAGLFLCAGIVEQNTHTKDITKLGGLISAMPITAMAFLCCAFSVMGIPPFGGFWSKYFTFSAALSVGQLFNSGVFLCGAVLTILYLFRVFNLVFLGEAHTPAVKEGSLTMVFSVATLALLSLLAGIFIRFPFLFAQNAAREMLGMLK